MILESGIHVRLTKNPEPSAWNLGSLTWNPKSKNVFHFQTWQFYSDVDRFFLHVKS